MPLTVYCGPFQPCLEEAFTARLKELSPAPVTVVSPSSRMSDRLQRLAAREAGLALLGVRFLTFHAFALDVLRRSGAAGALAADDVFHDRLVETLSSRRAAAPSRGLAPALRESLRDLAEGLVDPAQFREHFRDELARRPALADLLNLEEDYLRALADLGLFSPETLPQAAAARVRAAPAAALPPGAEILYYGFYDLNGAQADFFQAVAEAAPASLFFPYRKGHPAFAFADRFYHLKLHQGGRPPTHLPPAPETRALGPVLDALFVPGKSARPRDGALRLYSAFGVRDEAWKTAKLIRALRDDPRAPVPFRDVGVVARDLRTYRSALPEAFAENGIPFFWGDDEPLRRRPLARLCVSLLTLRRRDFPAQAVLDIIGSPYFRFAEGGGRARRWKRLIERLGIHSGWLQWAGKAGAWAGRDLELFPDEVREGRKGYVVPAEDTAALWSLLEDLRRRLDPRRVFSAWPDAAREAAALLRDHFAPAGEDAGLWEECLEAVAQLAALDRLPGPVSWDVFLDALEEKFRRAARPAPPANDGVRALNAMDARGESFRVLFLLGLEEGAFPRKIREDPFLSDSDRGFLQQPGGHWIQPKLAGYDEEKLLFYLAASSASERLVCLFPRSDDAGKVAVPSLYLRELARAAGLDWDAGAAERVPRAPYEKWDGLRPEELSPKEITLQAARAGRGAESFLAAAGGDAPLFSAGRAAVEELKRVGEPGPLDGLAGPSADFARELSRRGLSATALNDYVSCPFRFFALRRLGLRAEEPLARGELDPRLRGKIHHAVLQKFYEDLAAAGHWKTPVADWRPFLERALDETFRVHDWRSLGLYPVLWESFRRRTGLLLRDFAAADLEELSLSGFAPAFFELALGPVPVEDQPVAWQGRLDRVDAAEAGNRFRVVDYKSRWGGGGRDLTKEVWRGAENQPLFYLELAARDPRLGLTRKPDGARYLPVEPGKKSKAEKLAFPAAVWEARRAELLRSAARLTEKLLAGEFPIRPDEERGGVCGLCDFPFLCRKSHPLTRVRAERAGVIKIMAEREAPPS